MKQNALCRKFLKLLRFKMLGGRHVDKQRFYIFKLLGKFYIHYTLQILIIPLYISEVVKYFIYRFTNHILVSISIIHIQLIILTIIIFDVYVEVITNFLI